MKLSDKGALEICEHEGIVLAPYKDSVGVMTVYVGHTSGAGKPFPASMPLAMPPTSEWDATIDKALAQFKIDAAKYDKRVQQAIKVPLKQHQHDALVSFDLNTGGIFRARLTEKINAHAPGASRHFFGWLKPPEIRKRRTAEERLFVTGNYDHNGDDIPVWATNGRGKLTRVVRVIDGKDLLARMNGGPAAPAPPKRKPTNKVAGGIVGGTTIATATVVWWAEIKAAACAAVWFCGG